jgi:hypothetical protein
MVVKVLKLIERVANLYKAYCRYLLQRLANLQPIIKKATGYSSFFNVFICSY